MMRETDWARERSIPTVEEYMSNGRVTFALGPIVLITLYFLGSKMTEEVVTSGEYTRLYKHLSMIGRLLNDLQTHKVNFLIINIFKHFLQ